MKNILLSLILVFVLFTNTLGEYNPDKIVSNDGVSTDMIMTTSFVATMHQSWDLNFDTLNDCENEGTCDDSIDSTKPKTYTNSADFLASEGQICTSATDGCNNVSIWNGQLGAMTMMYCEDIYGEKGQEKWSCNEYDTKKIDHMKYIYQNISNLTDKKPVLGGTWYVTNINWESDNKIIVTFEDGHIEETDTFGVDDLVEQEVFICTMEYAPVCGVNGKTYSNKCMAGSNPILYNGECEALVDTKQFQKYSSQVEKLINILKNVSNDKKTEVIQKINNQIEVTKLQRIATWVQKQKITAYVFLREVIISSM